MLGRQPLFVIVMIALVLGASGTLGVLAWFARTLK
jgi:hypothetical protein